MTGQVGLGLQELTVSGLRNAVQPGDGNQAEERENERVL